jgi:copper chaperone CopZ
MKRLWLALLLTLPLGCQPAAESESATDINSTSTAALAPAQESVTDQSHLTQLVFAVEGMQCSVACPPHVTNALKSVAGVGAVEVDYASKQARVNVDPAQFNQAAALQALADAGFQGSLN